jgi:hypothetical protein
VKEEVLIIMPEISQQSTESRIVKCETAGVEHNCNRKIKGRAVYTLIHQTYVRWAGECVARASKLQKRSTVVTFTLLDTCGINHPQQLMV